MSSPSWICLRLFLLQFIGMEDQSYFENNSSSVLLQKKRLEEEGVLSTSATCFIICASFYLKRDKNEEMSEC